MKYLIVLATLLFANHVSAEVTERDGKFLSMFNIVRFPNDHCDAGDSRNGTCYTKEECSNKGGTEDGSCASGYGVCCTFVTNCGASLSENNTYFESEGEEKSHCSIQLCKGKDNIVQLRLDFITFVINGPKTDYTATDALTIAGASVGVGGIASSLASRCLTDVFSVSNPGGPSPPQICGTSTDEHMYVDMGADCVDLTFQLGTGARTVADPHWTIRITQYDRGYTNLAPFGCTQYHWKQDSDSDGKGNIKSFNWQGGYHLANQKQVICIRREDAQKRICYGVAVVTDFAISGTAAVAAPSKNQCGGYKATAPYTGMFADAVIIPSLDDNAAPPVTLAWSNLCGQSFAADTMTSFCTNRVPFVVTFSSDSFEDIGEESTAGGATKSNNGFRLYYEQKSS